jgi:hypothetical protein
MLKTALAKQCLHLKIKILPLKTEHNQFTDSAMQRVKYGIHWVRHSVTAIQGASQTPPLLQEFQPA